MDQIGGNSSRPPSDLTAGVSPATGKLLKDVYAGIDPRRLADYHVHLVGAGENGSGCYVNPRMRSWSHPVHRLKFGVYCSAGRIADVAHGESQYNARLLELAQTAPGRLLLLAFEENRRADGRVVPAKTEFHVPNDYALRVACAAPGHFAAAGSVHPLRADACTELRRLHGRGVRIIKWLPNAMGINPADPRCDSFYQTMRELHMALLTHGGMEAAVDAAQDQCLGNPQHLKRPLELGVKVIVAHCASTGTGVDEDAAPGAPEVENWKLLLRMMENPRWKGLLFADISAIAQYNRSPEFLRAILERPDLQKRLVNGSDYPLPAVNFVIWLRRWVRAGLLDPADVAPLQELYAVNPLVFDFALKRRLRVIGTGGRVNRFSPRMFEENPALPLAGKRGQRAVALGG